MKINTANFGPCLAKIQAKGKLSDLEARDLLSEVAERAEAMRQTGVKDPFVTAAGELAAKLVDNAVKDRLDALRNSAKRKAIYYRVQANYGGDLKKAALSLESEMVHVNTKMANMEAPVEEVATGILFRYATAIDNKLRQDGLEHAVVGGGMDREISRALFEMSGMGPKQTKAPTDLANKAAMAFEAPLAQLAERLKAAGARFERAVDYVTHTTHNPRAMIDAKFDQWWRKTKPRLSDYTFRDLAPKDGETMEQAKDRFGQSVYNALITGIHMTSDHMTSLMSDDMGYIPPAFDGSRNMAKKFSHQRVLFWKDADSWYDHMREFGGMTTLYHTVHQVLQSGANGIALMEKFGTNPMGSLNMLIRKVQEDFRDKDPLGVINFNNKSAHLINVMGRLDGSLNVPVSADWAQFTGTLRTIESATMLGNVGVTHLMSLPATLGSLAPHYGIGRAEVYGNALKALVQGLGPKEKQDLLSEAGAFSHGTLAHYMAQLRTSDNIPGRVSALAGVFLKATGLNYVLENTQNGVRYLLMHHLGRQTDVAYDALNPLLRGNLGRYGITAEVWDAMRTLPGLQKFEGRQYITPKDLERIPDAAIDQMNAPALAALKGSPPDILAETERLRGKTRWQLQDNYAALLAHAGREATVAAGARERAWALGSTQPGSMQGELWRFISQFKMWPIAVINQLHGRNFFAEQSLARKLSNFGLLMGFSTIGGMMRMAIRDLATGSTPRDMHDPKTLLAAMAQGGGIGIYGDFLFGETNRMGGGIMTTLAGPVIGDAANFANIFLKFRDDVYGLGGDAHHGRGAFVDVWPELARYGVHHLPFANLIGLKGALDYLVWNSMYEALSPGWFERSQRRMQKDQGRTLMYYKPGMGPPGIFGKHF